MRVFIDTNVLISAALFPGGVAARAYERAVSDPNEPVVSDYVVDELGRVFARKFPGIGHPRMVAAGEFLGLSL